MYTLETFEQKVNTITSDKIKILNFNGVKKSVDFICLQCGKIQHVNKGESLVRSGKKYQCQYCHYSKENITLETKHKIENICKKKNIKLISYTQAQENASFECPKCKNIFSRTSSRFLKNQDCPFCKRTKKLPLNIYLEDLKKVHGEEYEIVNLADYDGTHVPILFKHSCGFIWKCMPTTLLYHSCPKCARKTSKGEKAIRDYLEQNKIEYIWQYEQEINGKKLWFDFYLPKYKIFIEFQGEQHYKPIDYFGGEKTFLRQKENDLLKKEWCNNTGVHLLEISYSDFDRINEILESSTTSI